MHRRDQNRLSANRQKHHKLFYLDFMGLRDKAIGPVDEPHFIKDRVNLMNAAAKFI